MNPKRWRYGSSGNRRRSWRSVSGSSSASRARRVASGLGDSGSSGVVADTVCISREGDRLVAVQDVVGVDPERPLGRVGGDRRVAVAIAADPRARSGSEGRDVRGGPARRMSRRPRRASTARYRRGTSVNSVASNTAIAVRTSSSGSGATARRSEVRHRSVISSRSRRRISAILGRGQSRVVEPLEEHRAAPQRDERRPSAGLRGVGGQDGRDPQARDDARRGRRRSRPARRSRAIASATESSRSAVACRPLASAQGPDAAASLGEVDQLEVQRERA